MLTSITPLGERGRAMRWGVTASTHVVGSALGGALLGTGAGAVGALAALGAAPATPVLLGLAAVGMLAASVGDLSPLRPPTLRRQVDEQWLGRYRGWVYGGGFGLQLGAGVLTVVTTWSVYLVAVLAALSGSVGAGAVLGAVFGTARALPVLAMAGASTAAAVAGTMRRVAAAARRVETATSALLVLAAAVTSVAATGGTW